MRTINGFTCDECGHGSLRHHKSGSGYQFCEYGGCLCRKRRNKIIPKDIKKPIGTTVLIGIVGVFFAITMALTLSAHQGFVRNNYVQTPTHVVNQWEGPDGDQWAQVNYKFQSQTRNLSFDADQDKVNIPRHPEAMYFWMNKHTGMIYPGWDYPTGGVSALWVPYVFFCLGFLVMGVLSGYFGFDIIGSYDRQFRRIKAKHDADPMNDPIFAKYFKQAVAELESSGTMHADEIAREYAKAMQKSGRYDR